MNQDVGKDAGKDAGKTRKSTLPDWAKVGRGPAQAAKEKAAADLRLPRNLAWLGAGIGAVVLLAAFGVGWQAGKKSGLAESESKYQKEIARITRNMTQTQGAPAAGPAQGPTVPPAAKEGGKAPAVPVAPPASVAADPREAGLNYWILCQVPVAEARKLADFLATEGRRTWLVPVAAAKSGNPGMAKVYVVNRGYHYRADRVEIERSRAELWALGDKWARKNKGGNPFRTLALEQYRK